MPARCANCLREAAAVERALADVSANPTPEARGRLRAAAEFAARALRGDGTGCICALDAGRLALHFLDDGDTRAAREVLADPAAWHREGAHLAGQAHDAARCVLCGEARARQAEVAS